MPNWCYTNIQIHHESKIKLRRLMRKLEEWTSVNYAENGFGLEWLGNIVGNSGIGSWTNELNKKRFECRGRLDGYELMDGYISLSTETAWSPMLGMWYAIIDEYIPGAELYYTAEESGCGLYNTNDPDYEGKYIVDAWDIDIESDWEASEETVVEILQGLLNVKEDDVNILLNLFEEDEELTDGMAIHKWDYDPGRCYDE